MNRHLIVGLGNPGRRHLKNRHNLGFMVLDRLAEKNGIDISRRKHKALIGLGTIQALPIILAKPQTYMNLSGDAVVRVKDFYGLLPEDLTVIYDEIDLPLGTLRIREAGGSGGHNGMKSVINRIGREFPRIRLGVGRPPGQGDPSSYLLSDFTADELPVVEDMIEMAVSAVEFMLVEGLDLAMTRFNGVIQSDRPE